jgi:peptidoglycan/LPS O-acetylase OafA/YrhL
MTQLASDLNPLAEIPSESNRPAESRVIWVDNLRTAMIVLVVNMHACVTYSHVGSWYTMADPEPTTSMKIPFVFWQGHLQAFFMGLLFFIAGYFADKSLSRKKRGPFLGERLRRLGVPTLIYMLIIHPFMVFGLLTPASERPSAGWFFSQYLGHGRFLSGSGPMWFAFALLLICIPFGLIFKPGKPGTAVSPIELKPLAVLGIGIGLGVASFLVRLVQPIGTSVFNFQLCYFAQYLVAFGLGVVVSRRNSLNAIATSRVARWAGWLAVCLGPLALATIALFAMPDLSKNPPPFNGGWNWEALAVALWEQMSGVGLALGSMALCARLFHSKGSLSGWLSDRSFGVYLLHPPILVALALSMAAIRGNIYLMALALTVAGCVLSFIAADLARRIPLLKSVL